MSRSAPRISRRLLREIEHAAHGGGSIAEICRSIGIAADQLGVPRPSYEQIRIHVHAARRWRRAHPSAAEVALDVAFRVKPVTAVLDHLAGTD
jgi:hypothetical protein